MELKLRPSPRVQRAWFALKYILFCNVLLTVALSRNLGRVYETSGRDMLPTLAVGERVFVNLLGYKLHSPRRGDLVFFVMPEESPDSSNVAVRRCVGCPGDRLEMLMGHLKVNGQWASEAYTQMAVGGPQSAGDRLLYDMKIVGDKVFSRKYDADGYPGAWYCEGTRAADQQSLSKATSGKVPPGMYVMLGDYRKGENDSHTWGFVPERFVLGRAMLSISRGHRL